MEVPKFLPGTTIPGRLIVKGKPVETAPLRTIAFGTWEVVGQPAGTGEQLALAGYVYMHCDFVSVVGFVCEYSQRSRHLFQTKPEPVTISDARRNRTYVSAAIAWYMEINIAESDAYIDREIAARERKVSRKPAAPKYGWPTAAYTRQWNKHLKEHESCCYSEDSKGHDHGVLNVA